MIFPLDLSGLFNGHTTVKIECGLHKGKLGCIAGTLANRQKLIAKGLRRLIVKVDGEYIGMPISSVREITDAEEKLLTSNFPRHIDRNGKGRY
jgi:hypothetical protein